MIVLAAMSSNQVSRLGVYALVLAAIIIIVMLMWRWLFDLTEERAEKLDSVEDKGKGGANSLAYFISRGGLFRLQVGSSAFVAVLTVATMLVFGVYSPMLLLIGAVVSGGLVAYEIKQHFVRKVAKRSLAFQGQMLDLTMGLANGLKAGQALPQALEVYAKNTTEPLFGELRVVQREYRLGVDLAEALTRMYRRIPNEDLQLMIVSIKLTMTSGGSLAEVLQKMTETIRSRNDFARKLAALTAQGRFEALAMSLAPVAAFFILLAVDSSLMIPLLTSVTGWIAIGVDVVLITVGYSIIRAITNVEV